MDKESLIIAREVLIKALEKSRIENKVDKFELMQNIYTLLEEKNYEHDIKVLRLYGKGSKR